MCESWGEKNYMKSVLIIFFKLSVTMHSKEKWEKIETVISYLLICLIQY